MARRVVILGDLICDNNLIEWPSTTTIHSKLPTTSLQKTEGGAGYLHLLVKTLQTFAGRQELTDQPLAEALREAAVAAPQLEGGWLDKAEQVFQVWAPFPREVGVKDTVWRINRLLGSSPPKEAVAFHVLDRNPAVLVMDSLALGFLERDPQKTLEAVQAIAPGEILLKLSSVASGIPLIGEFSDRVTVVVPVKALRERGAAISQGLSWDHTIEETVRELARGISASDLARCRRVVVGFGAEGAAVFSRVGLPRIDDAPLLPRAELRAFLYDGKAYEGDGKAKRQGVTYGDASILTTALLLHLLAPQAFPLFIAVGRALAAASAVHEAGLSITKATGKGYVLDFDKQLVAIAETFLAPTKGGKPHEPADRYACAFSPRIRGAQDPGDFEPDLLRAETGDGLSYVAAKALDIVIRGWGTALRHAPVAHYRAYFTADREEIERVNALKRLILAYRNTREVRRPLSIAVFGPPGSGKSFAIKQVAKEIGFANSAMLEFNLSQFEDMEQLHAAFHVVRDASVRGEIPLVFWDEFDSQGLRWLKDFLAPMQDAEFRAGSLSHPFGRAVFIFAGGTRSTFEAFEQCGMADPAGLKGAEGSKEGCSFKDLKGPDFISRLRGFVNIKGPNPVRLSECREPQAGTPRPAAEADPAHLIRRAIILRSLLERTCPHLIDGESKLAAISPAVAQAFLRVAEYKHGARSLEAVVTMSDLGSATYFGESALPPKYLLDLHVNADEFLACVAQHVLEAPVVEILAEACHAAWAKEKSDQGYVYDSERSDKDPKTHPLLLPYQKLSEKDKEGNRITARLTQAKLVQVGLEIRPARSVGAMEGLKEFGPEDLKRLMEIEHDVWMRDHLLGGYEFAEETNDRLRLHRNVLPFAKLEKKDQELDAVIVKSIPGALEKGGYVIVKRG